MSESRRYLRALSGVRASRTMRRSPAVVRGSILIEFKRLALALDLNPIALIERVGLDRVHLEDPDLTVPARAVVELFEIAALTSGVEDFGLRLGEVRGVPDFGPAILMLREEATVRDALRTLVTLLHLHSDAAYMHLEDAGTPIVTIDVMVGNAVSCRQTIDSGVAGLTHILRWLLGDGWNPASVAFKHSRPKCCTRYDRFFRCPVDFLHDFNGVVLRRRDLDRKLPASSPVLKREVERYIRTINVEPSDIYGYRVTQIVAMALGRGEARAEVVARYLGTDRRTLNRRLARSGLNYSSVVDNVRRNLATQYLLSSDRPLADIAGLIGFESSRAFGRWFVQSFKATPAAWRRRRRQAARG